MGNYVYYLMIVGYVIIFYFLISLFLPSANIFFHIGILKKYKKIQYESEYFRDILTYSPSEIFYIYNKNFRYRIKNDTFNRYRFRKLFLINLLKMGILGYITIDFTDKNNFKIIKKDIIILDEEYSMINNYIFNQITSNREITLYEIYEYVNKNYNDYYFIKWDEFIQNQVKQRGFYNGNFLTFYEKEIKVFYKITIPIIVITNIIIAIISSKVGFIMFPVFVLFLIFGYHETKNIKVISDTGVYEYRKMIALKKFLKDFSTIDQKGPEYSKILEDYVVYASIFNILKNKIWIGNIISEIRHFITNLLKK